MPKTGVFISYNHQDKLIADAISEALTSISSELDVFIDHFGLEGGDEYEPKIARSIHNSQWFIIVSSGSSNPDKNMNWCFYEAGQFRAKMESESQNADIRSRMCCLYDGDKLGPLSTYQGTLVTSKDRDAHELNLQLETDHSLYYENTELFSLFDVILKKSAPDHLLRDTSDLTTRKLMRNGVRKISWAFQKSAGRDALGEIVFQPRISFILNPSVGGTPVGLAADTSIDGEDTRTLSTMFGINGQFTLWGDIKDVALSSHNIAALWIEEVENAISNISRNRVPVQPQTLCIGNDNNFYLPVIARYKYYRNDAKKCYVVFIPSPNKKFAVSVRSSILLSGLILSVRFRQRILPMVLELNAVQPNDNAAIKQMELLTKLQKELVSIEIEAVEFGLPVVKDEHEDPPLLNAFREGDIKEKLRDEITKWTLIRNALLDKISKARAGQNGVTPSRSSKICN